MGMTYHAIFNCMVCDKTTVSPCRSLISCFKSHRCLRPQIHLNLTFGDIRILGNGWTLVLCEAACCVHLNRLAYLDLTSILKKGLGAFDGVEGSNTSCRAVLLLKSSGSRLSRAFSNVCPSSFRASQSRRSRGATALVSLIAMTIEYQRQMS